MIGQVVEHIKSYLQHRESLITKEMYSKTNRKENLQGGQETN